MIQNLGVNKFMFWMRHQTVVISLFLKPKVMTEVLEILYPPKQANRSCGLYGAFDCTKLMSNLVFKVEAHSHTIAMLFLLIFTIIIYLDF